MPWTAERFPDAMKHLAPPVRRRAVRIANALLREGYDEGEAIRIAIARAKGALAKGYYLAYDENGFALVFWLEPAELVHKADGGDLGPNERWITLKPHGPDHPDYVHVKIKVNPDGSAHVVSGPKGLHGLRLTRIGRGRQQERAPKPDVPPEERQRRKELAQRLQEHIEAAHRAALAAAARITGNPHLERMLDDETREQLRTIAQQAAGEGDAASLAAGLATARHVRAATQAVKRIERQVLKHLVRDPDLRSAVLGERGQIEPDEIPGAETAPVASRGYGGSMRQLAEERGLTQDEFEREAEEAFQARLAQYAPEVQARVLAARERMRAAQPLAQEAGAALEEAAPKPEAPTPEELRQHAEDVRAFLAAARQLRKLQRAKRRALLGHDPDASEEEVRALEEAHAREDGSPLLVHTEEVDPDLAREIAARVDDLAKEDLTRSFLDTVNRAAEPGWSYGELRKALYKHHAAGAYAHLSNVALAVLGRDTLDRLALDALGLDAGVKLTAHALRRGLSEEELDKVRKALAEHHDRTLEPMLKEAMERGTKALEAARAIEIPAITSTTDAAAVMDLVRRKRRLLEEAHRHLGTALGKLEASAALNLALSQPPADHLELEFSKSARDVIPALRALGLEPGDYTYEWDDDRFRVRLNRQGMDRLTPDADPAERETAERVKAIKAGRHDEEDWLPAGFARYPASAFDQQEPPKARRLARAPNFRDDVRAGLEEAVASRLADGWTPAEVKRLLTSSSFIRDWVPPEKMEEYDRHLEELLPTWAGEEVRKNRKGEEYRVPIPVDYDRLQEKHPELHERLRGLARDFVEREHPGEADFYGQTVGDTPEVRKALYLSVLADPRTQVALKPLGELDHRDQRALRHYYLTEILGKSPEELAARKNAVRKALAEYEAKHPMPEKWGAPQDGGLFGEPAPVDPDAPITLRFRDHVAADPDLRAETLRAMGLGRGDYVENDDGSVTLTEDGKANLRGNPYPDRLASDLPLNPDWVKWHRDRQRVATEALGDQAELVEWNKFVEGIGGPQRAYEAVQEHMRGSLASRYAHYHAKLTGQPLRLSKEANRWGEHLWAVRDPEGYRRFKDEIARQQHSLRERQGGRFAYMGGKGSLLEAWRKKKEEERAARMAQASLFANAGDEAVEPEAPVPHLERHALPPAVEKRLAALMPEVAGSVHAGMSPVQMYPVTMGKGTKYVKQQRAIKAIIEGRKLAAFLGTGSGKTSVAIGAFTELHHRGEAKKGLFVVPSIVRDQFGEEMARVLEPGRFRWHAREATHEERRAAYATPDVHMVAVTHQAFRDDMLKLMAEHHGEDLEAFKDRFLEADLPERQRLMREALEAHGIPLHYVAVDEAHDALNRQGKAESLLTAVLDTAMSLSPYGTLMTGSPVKNDASEIGDWLKKLDPKRFGDAAEFRRRYGVDALTAREALKRLADRYVYHDVVPSGTTKRVVWGADGTRGDTPSGHAPIPLHPEQRAQLEEVRAAYQRAVRARDRGDVDLEALRALSPRSFEGVPEAQHEQVAQKLNRSLGVLHEAAKARVINEAPADRNAKIQHLLSLAEQRRGKGGVVFAHNRKAVAEIAAALERAGHKVAVLHGGHSAQDKARIRQRFDRGEVDIIVASDAGATGANLQHRGEWLVHYDLPMTHKTWEQRSARIDRLGQKKAIEIHTLMTDTDHDRANLERLERKRLLGQIFQGPYEHMDDTGLALQLQLAGLSRPERDDDDDPTPPPPPAPNPAAQQGTLFG